MSKELTPRVQAIRKNVVHLDQHIQEFISSCENIRDALDTLEDTALLRKVFVQIMESLQQLSAHTKKSEISLVWETEELLTITKIDNNINVHLRRIEELMEGIQKVFSTSRLGQAVWFALIEQEVVRIRRTRKNALEIYYTIKAHYTDQEGQITRFLEDSWQNNTWKMLHKALKNNHLLWK